MKKRKKTIKEEIIDKQTRDFVRKEVEEMEKAKESLKRMLKTSICEEEREEIYKLFRQTIQCFMGETIEKEYKEIKNPDTLVRVFYENVRKKQAKWLKENL